MLKFYLLFATIIGGALLSDWYLLRRVIPNRRWKTLFLAKAILLHLLFFSAFFMPMAVMIWVILLYFILYIPQILFALLTICRVPFRIPISLFLFGVMLYGATIGRIIPRVESCEVQIDRLPEKFSGYKIVQLSDFHIGNFSNNGKAVQRIIDRVNALNPDIIVFTGDLVNLRADELYPFLKILSSLKAKDGLFSVMGNHDYGDYVRWKTPQEREDNLKELKTLQAQIGWKLLDNAHQKIGKGTDSIAVVGVENWGLPPFPKYGNLEAATNSLDSETVKILLSHNPTHWEAEVLNRKDIDLTLSGHTHAMQMKISFFGFSYSPASHMYKFWNTLHQVEQQYLYVNEGVGYVGLPIRIGTRPEITEIILR